MLSLVWVWPSPLRRKFLFERPFSSRAKRRLLLVSQPDAISQSQIFPFHFYKDVLRERWGYEVREIDYGSIDADGFGHLKGADVVCFQAWIDQTPAQLQAMAERLRR